MIELVPLAIWPHDVSEERMTLIREAKAALDLDFRVLPSPAVPGSPTRVLAMGVLPPFVCDAALVKDPDDAESICNALNWVLTASAGDSRGFMVLDYLRAILGEDVNEVFDDMGVHFE